MRVIVIGSGIAGASAAYHLARRGAEVVVVDADRTGAATAAGAGIISPWATRDELHYPFAAAAASYYPELVAELGEHTAEETSYAVVGALVASADEAVLRAAHERVEARAATRPAAGEVALLDPAQARELFPPLAPELAAVHISGGARVDGRRIRASMLDAARARGAELRSGHAELDGDGVRVSGESIAADAVVVAAGAWSGELVAALGVRIDIAPQRGQISHLGVADIAGIAGTPTARWPVVSPVSSHYLLAFPDARVVVGATRETGAGFDHRVTAAGQAEVLEQALAVAPGLRDATLLETRVGFRPASADGQPVLGPLRDHPHVVLASGFGSGGLTLAPYAGSLVADLALGEPVSFDLTPFRPDRFGDG
ncbi:NAD(P)/FAD-dependent oxidoreductase [Pseudonocardia nigra]|uniref:NAD(P)/FAD-dependent oxidoreductase n=1 Tax=Pseudonocardia nigra TaxID=1921578 RepID=UPI001C5D8F56|nr:FAD-binding oxidoreductase [Pseudonocardia nigra]